MSNNAPLARRWFEEVWNDRRDATVDELMHSEAVGHMEGLEIKGPSEFLSAVPGTPPPTNSGPGALLRQWRLYIIYLIGRCSLGDRPPRAAGLRT